MTHGHYSAIWTINRVSELLALITKEEEQGALGGGQCAQWNGIVRKLCSPSSPMMELIKVQTMEDLQQKLQRGCATKQTLKPELEVAQAYLEEQISQANKEQEKKARKGWRDWLVKQSGAGGASGAAHAFIKRVQLEPDLLVTCLEGKSAAPQDIVRADFEEWKGVWDSLQDKAGAPWRGAQSHKEGWGRLRKITIAQFRRVARSFKSNTGVGIDGVSPHQFAWLSDDLVHCTLQLFEEIELECSWPEQIATAMIHLIPKEAGGRRPIAIIASLVRIWVKCRRDEVREWKAQQQCDYDWMGQGRGAERAVWAQSVIEEAQRQR